MRNTKKGNGILCEKPQVKYSFMKQEKWRFSLRKMANVLNVSLSGYYKWLKEPFSPRKVRKERMKALVISEYEKSKGRYGAPKITKRLRATGEIVSRKYIGKLMNELGIRSIVKRKYIATTNSNHKLPVAENLLNQNFQTSKPCEVMVGDITYIPTDEGWVYLSTLMDLYTRRIIGFAMDSRMTKELTIKTLNRALGHLKETQNLIHHSDRGVQYCSIAYQELLKDNGITCSMSRKGNCYDNAVIESFHSILKKELVYHEKYKTRQQAIDSITDYILHFYNSNRIHGSINDCTPIQFEKLFYVSKSKKVS